jgi:hypothetical protein
MNNNPIKTITKAVVVVFKLRSYLLLGVSSFIVLFILYSFVLPATYTGGRIGWVSLRFLNLKLAIFALLFSAALSLIMPFAFYAFRKRKSKKSSVAAGSFIGSILPPLLCCSPFLPSIAALLGGFTPFAFRISGFLQGIIATYETQIFIGITAILVYSVYLNARQVILAENQLCDC